MAILSVSHKKHILYVHYVGWRVNVAGEQWLCVVKDVRKQKYTTWKKLRSSYMWKWEVLIVREKLGIRLYTNRLAN